MDLFRKALLVSLSFLPLIALADSPTHPFSLGLDYGLVRPTDAGMNIKGILLQGISTPYYQANYSYTTYSAQYLLDAKLRRQFNTRFFPYLYLGLGVAANRAFNFATTVPPYLTVTPSYGNNNLHCFTYSAGFGLDYMIMPQASVGLGYRYINLGKVGLASGIIRTTSVKAWLTQSNLYLNSLIAQVNFYI
jgi:opacity protein-like surface antigen